MQQQNDHITFVFTAFLIIAFAMSAAMPDINNHDYARRLTVTEHKGMADVVHSTATRHEIYQARIVNERSLPG
jgi:hypothetical protein